MHDYSYRVSGESKFSYKINKVSDEIELYTNVIFTIEIVLLVLAYGFQRKTLNQLFTILNFLLFSVIVSSWISYATDEYEFFNVYRNIRTLTIFRLFPVLAKKVNAFFGSFKHLGKTFFPLLCVIILYSVMGLSFFRGHIESRCRLTEYPIDGEKTWPIDESVELTCGEVSCPSQTYCRNPAEYGIAENHEEFNTESLLWGYVNFNDIFNALFSVYNFLMINGWISTTNIYWRAQDKTLCGIYFVSLVLLLQYFSFSSEFFFIFFKQNRSQIISNIILATLYEGFMGSHNNDKLKAVESAVSNDKDVKEQLVEKKSIFKKKQKNNLNFKNDSTQDQDKMKKKDFTLQSQISSSRIDQSRNLSAEQFNLFFVSLYRYIKQFRKSTLFSILHFSNILAIIIVLCIDNISIQGSDYKVLNKVDFSLTMIFFSLSFVELFTFGKKYFQQKLLLLDGFIILLNSISYIVESSHGYDIFNPYYQTFIFIRWTKILRILRLINEFPLFGSLKILLHTYYYTLASLPEFLFVWLLLIILIVQIGREMFAGRDGVHGHSEHEQIIRMDYNTLQSSLIAVIMICYNEEWHLVMYKYRRQVGYKSILFHFFAMLILQVLFVRLFIAIFINTFMEWLRQNEIILQDQQTLVIIKKLTRQITNFFSTKKNQIQPVQQAQKQNILRQQSSISIKDSTKQRQQFQKDEILEKDEDMRYEIKVIDQNVNSKQQNCSNLINEQDKQKNNNIQKYSNIKHSTSIEKIDDNLTKRQILKRKQSLEILRESTQPSKSVIKSRSKSNDNLLSYHKQAEIYRDRSFKLQSQLAAYRKTNTLSQATTLLNVTQNNYMFEKDKTQNKDAKNFHTFSDQKQSSTKMLSTPQKSVHNVLIGEEHRNIQNRLYSQEHAIFNQSNNQSQKKIGHSQLPSISLQSPINSSGLYPLITQIRQTNLQSQEQNQQEVESHPSQFRYDGQLVMSLDNLKDKQNSFGQAKNDDLMSQVNSNKERQKNTFIQKLSLPRNNSENKSLGSDGIKEINQQQDQLDNNSNAQKEQEEEQSLFLFSKENKFRKLCLKVVRHPYFNYFNSLCIVALAFLFIADTPFVDPDSSEKKVLVVLHSFLISFFVLENIVQIVAYGFILSPSSFIKRNWFFNSIDIITSVASFFYTTNFWPRQVYTFKFILILRISVLFSFLSNQVKEVHMAGIIMVKALPRMLRLIGFGMIFLVVSGALITKLLKGSMNSCYFLEEEDVKLLTPIIINKFDCLDLGGDWIDSQYNFNNLINSLQVLYMVQSSEGWIHIMFSVYDSTTPDQVSKYQQNSLWAIFFIQFFFIANICILNMFVGLVVETKLEIMEEENKTKDLHKFQKEWLFIKTSIYQLKPTAKLKIPRDAFRKFLFDHLIQGNKLKILFYTFTIANCINILLFRSRQPQDEIDQLYLVNEVCLIALLVEISCRIFCLNIEYFYEPWNIVDIIIAIIGWINLRFQQTNEFEIFDSRLRILDGIAKGLQILRFYRIMKHFTIIKKLFKSLQYAISSIYAIFQILIIFLFISVLISMNLFPYIKEQKIINGYDVTFRNFPNALFNLIRVMTGEYWYVIAQEAAKQMQPDFVCFDNIVLYEDYLKHGQNACGSRVSYFFFYGFFLVFTLVILNIFIATIIDSYKEAFSADESAVNHYQLDDVLELWKQYDPEGKGYISYKEFWQFSSQIAIIYGVKSEELMDIQNKKEFLRTLNIPIFEDPINKVFCYKFHDVVISISKVSVQIKYGITTQSIYFNIFNLIKHFKLSLEPEDPKMRLQLEQLIKKKKLSGDDMIKPTEFTSADMVLIIVLTRKVKQWKQKLLNKQDEFLFDIKQLTQKLKSQILKEQEQEQKEEEEQRKLKLLNQENAQLEINSKIDSMHSKEKSKGDNQLETDKLITIPVRTKLPPIDQNKIKHKVSPQHVPEKNVKFSEDLLTKPFDSVDNFKLNNNKDRKDSKDLIADSLSEKDKSSQSSNKNLQDNLSQTDKQQNNTQTKKKKQKSLKLNKTEVSTKSSNNKQNKLERKFSFPQNLFEFKANSVIQQQEDYMTDDFGLEVNFNQNFILAYDEEQDDQNK